MIGVSNGTSKQTRVSTTVWLTESVDRALRRNLCQNKVDLVIDYLIQRSLIPRYVVAEHDHNPWAVTHPDLHHSNIIVDEHFNIKG
jgi:hypothetical protein